MKNNIEKLRKEKGLTQDDLANKLNVSRQTINAIENKKYSPSLKLAFKISNLFKKRIEEVFIYEITS